MNNKIMLKGVDKALYTRFKTLCVKLGLLVMPKASDLFNQAIGDFIIEKEKEQPVDEDAIYPEVKGDKKGGE
jgi:hypothetical protein